MNLDQTFSILFWLNRAKANKKGFAPIWIRITVDGKRAECSTSRKIISEHWDVENGVASNDCPTASAINGYLRSVHAEITRRYNILLTIKDYVSAEDVKASFKGKKKELEKPPMPKKTLFGLYKDFISHQEALVKKEELSKGRFKRFPVTRGKVEEFIKALLKRDDIPLEEKALYEGNDIVLEKVPQPFIVRFQHYLLTVGGIGHNTSMKHAKDLKQPAGAAALLDIICGFSFAWLVHTLQEQGRKQFDPSFAIRPADYDLVRLLLVYFLASAAVKPAL